MRGVDYKTYCGGIRLLLAEQVPNDRALVQAGGRVGRYGQASKKFKLAEVGDGVNHDLER